MTIEDTDAWVETLSGRQQPPEGDSLTPRLRNTVRRLENDSPPPALGLQRLMKRLEVEGLLRGTPRRSVWTSFAVAASVSLAVLLGSLLFVDDRIWRVGLGDDEVIRYRGIGQTVPVSVVGDPARWIARTERVLERAGCAHSRPQGKQELLVVDVAPHCLAVINRRLPRGSPPLEQPGRYRFEVSAAVPSSPPTQGSR